MNKGFATAHDLICVNKFAPGHDLISVSGFVTGHDFSRAATGPKQRRALAPAVRFLPLQSQANQILAARGGNK